MDRVCEDRTGKLCMVCWKLCMELILTYLMCVMCVCNFVAVASRVGIPVDMQTI